jgi:CheY-like chemotaxis protein
MNRERVDRESAAWIEQHRDEIAAPRRFAAKPPGRRFLVVDDNVRVAKMLALLISRIGPHEVEMAFDGPSTLDKAASFQPEIILLDIGMPGMDGHTVGSLLRDIPQCAGSLLVALTGYGEDEDRLKSLEAGFDKHLVKPVDVDTLRQLCGDPKLNEADQRRRKAR